MYLVHLALRIYPYLAIALSLVFLQLGLHYRRKASRAQHWCWAGIAALILGAILWVVCRGDLNSDRWLRVLS